MVYKGTPDGELAGLRFSTIAAQKNGIAWNCLKGLQIQHIEVLPRVTCLQLPMKILTEQNKPLFDYAARSKSKATYVH